MSERHFSVGRHASATPCQAATRKLSRAEQRAVLHTFCLRSALAICLLAAPTMVVGQIPAFSGADGAARNVMGGRANGLGGIVYHVTKLNSAIDDSQRNDIGTLRYGLNAANFPA